MKTNKATVLTFAEKCKSILSSNWQGRLNTVKADAKGSKEDIYTSKIKYICKRGKPYIWVPEKDLHNVNLIVDERGSFSVASSIPGPLASLLRSLKKSPARVALTGDVVPLTDAKFSELSDDFIARLKLLAVQNVWDAENIKHPEDGLSKNFCNKAQSATEVLREVMLLEQKAISASSYTVSGVLSSSDHSSTSRSENLKDVLEGDEKYMVYKFNQISCMYIDGNGSTHDIDQEDMGGSKADPLAPLYAKLVDGINQSVARRRALMLFCLTYKNANAKDAYMLSVDHKGFDVLSKVAGPLLNDGMGQYQWKEFRFTLKEEARDVESFCRQLVEMEEDAVKELSSHSGLA